MPNPVPLSVSDFVVLRGDGAGCVKLCPGGFILVSGVRMFSRRTTPHAGAVSFRLGGVMAPEAVGPAGCWFNLGVVHGADPAALPPGTPTRDVDTAAIWNGWRITMANKALRPGSSDRLRLRIYPERRSVEPTSAPVLAPFGVGETHEVELAWGPSRVWLFVPTLAVGQGWNDPGLTVPDDSRLMFYGSPGGAWLVEDLRASDSE